MKKTPPTVLVIEDEEALREFFVFDLQAAGFNVLDAQDGEQGMKILREAKVDALVTDINLPKKSGIEILQELRTGAHPEKPVAVMISGRIDLALEESYHLGINAFFTKPFSRQTLLDAVMRLTLPEAERWTPENASKYWPKSKKIGDLEITLESYEKAISQKQLHLGHGGIFVSIAEGLPQPDELLGFKIQFEDRPDRFIEGQGIVRWIRMQSQKGLPTGIGMEITQMPPESLEYFLELKRQHPLISFIPKS